MRLAQRHPLGLRGQSGFSLLEVLIAMLILGVGLLGFALLQTMSIRFAQSSNHRTQATNLAYDMLDQMRSNRLLAAQYTYASFEGSAPGACDPVTGTVDIQNNIERWQCQVLTALGEGAAATVTYANGVASVEISWDDQRWESDPDRKKDEFETGVVKFGARL